jgi:hypothetical protein
MATDINIIQLEDPNLEFGGPGSFLDPKEGLKQGGPFDLRFGNARHDRINVGFVGTKDMLHTATSWFNRCKSIIPSQMPNQAQHPYFLGFKKIFHSELLFNDKWNYLIEEASISNALALLKKSDTFKKVLEIYATGFEHLSKSEVTKPDVIVCCLSDEIIKKCWSVTNEKVKSEDKKKARTLSSQLSLFSELRPEDTIEEQEEDILTRDFRRALKAKAMHFGIPIQIGTNRLFTDTSKSQDASIRAWNSSIALYYKAGGIPWRLRKERIETCYVGISFHHLYTTHNTHLVRSCIAQAFSSEGEGFAIRGVNVPWTKEQGRNVHLTEEQTYHLGEKILEEYRYRTGGTPLRIVLHKSTEFNEVEKKGLYASLNNVPIVELVHISPTEFRLVRFGEYPTKRGTLCIINNSTAYLFTTGFMPELKTYPGPHIPVPVKITTDGTDVLQACRDIMALSRMNWNTGSTTSGHPVTLLFSRRVGGIMAEFGDTTPPSSFRFYL